MVDFLCQLAEKESNLTGEPVNYKKKDERNIMLIPELLRLNTEEIVAEDA